MDERLAPVYQEALPLNMGTPRLLRQRLASLAPLLGDTTGVVQLAMSEIATAFARHSTGGDKLEIRLFASDDRFRVELADSLPTEYLTAASREGREEFFRQRILDDVTDRWGVFGNGTAVVWFEVVRTHRTVEETRDVVSEENGGTETKNGG